MTTVETSARAAGPLSRASVRDTLRVGAVVIAPTLARGILARRPRVVALTERFQADRRAGRLLQELRGRYGPGPLRLRLPGRSFAFVLSAPDVQRVLTGSPEPFALDSKEKRAALAHFQPHGVLASHGTERADRREFNERVLDTGRPVHRHADAITAKIGQEAEQLVSVIARTGELEWEEFRRAWWRVIRRVVLGDAARDDHEISDLLTRLRMNANWAFAHPRRRALRARFQHRLQRYLTRAERGSLAELIAATPTSAVTEPDDQVPQWLFAYEPAGMAAFRALALLASHPRHQEQAHQEAMTRSVDLPLLRACVQESVRLWPTTLSILRDTTTDTDWAETTMPAGTGLLIHTAFVQRDDQTLPFADSFEPGIWLDGTAEHDWSVIPFSAGPGECPGRDLVLLSTSLFLAALLRAYQFQPAAGPPLHPDQPLPRTLGPFNLRLHARPRTEGTAG